MQHLVHQGKAVARLADPTPLKEAFLHVNGTKHACKVSSAKTHSSPYLATQIKYLNDWDFQYEKYPQGV